MVALAKEGRQAKGPTHGGAIGRPSGEAGVVDGRRNGRTRGSSVGVERIPGRVVGRIVARAVPDHLRPGSPGSEGNEDGGSEEEKLGLAHVGIIAADARRGDGTAARTAADKRQDGISGPGRPRTRRRLDDARVEVGPDGRGQAARCH